MRTPTPLLRDLADVGVHVGDLWDLVNTDATYRAAVPVLLDWLRHADDRVPSQESAQIKEGLLRALTVREARPAAAPEIIRQFREIHDPLVRWAAGNALSVVADDSVFDELASLVRDTRYGTARQMIVQGLGRSKDPRAPGLLIGLLPDDDVVIHALNALARVKAPGARAAVTELLGHPRVVVRKTAEKALKKLP
ncbi:HEAT repeat domain-containing protein [Kibdelosporangium persicum]|nr:HEAT repeat domain-containing protein [Kibdelosporangium persicum]